MALFMTSESITRGGLLLIEETARRLSTGGKSRSADQLASNRDELNFIERSLIRPPVLELRGSRAFVVGDVLPDFEPATVFHVRGDADGAEGVVSDPRLDAGDGRAALNHPVS
jgi:hypothetical protein